MSPVRVQPSLNANPGMTGNTCRPSLRHLDCIWLLLGILLTGCATGTAYQPGTDTDLPMKLGRIQQLD
jgi:hypothetical protein